jgi:hypothetical protein
MANVYSGGEPYVYEGGGIFRRVSWGALFAGVVVALVVELVFTLLGLGIGLGSIKPATEAQPFSGIGKGAAIWLGLTTLIAVFLGGWVTAKLAGSVRGLNGVLHSIVMWGLVSLLSFYLMTTAIGALVGGAASVIGKGLSAVTSGAAAVAPEAAKVIQQELAERGITVDKMLNEAKQLAGRTGAGGGAAAEDQDLKEALQRVFTSGQTSVSAADKEALVNALTVRTNMSRQDAEKKVDSWIQEYQQTIQAAQETRQQALQTSERALQGLSKASIWIFVLMVLEAAAAAWGGWLGSSRELAPPA